MNEIPKPNKRLLRLQQVLERFPIGRTSWFDGIRQGRYPKSIHIGPRTVAWLEEDLDQLLEKLVQDSKNEGE
jgi:predicted DNA-binding transcriptional regulator AlpA